MATVAQEAKKILAKLPKNATWEDLQYEIYVRAAVDRGLEDIRKGRLISHAEVVKRMKKWRTK